MDTLMINTKRLAAVMFAVACCSQLSACITPHSYVDSTLGEPRYSDLKKPEQPAPIQLLFEFQTKGVSNARATEATKQVVSKQLLQSGLFSQVSFDPVPSGRKLMISIDNVPQSDASKKGFTTGLTLGIAGTVVTDEYVCKVSYAEPGHDLITKEVHHAIYSTIGNASAPAGVGPMAPRDAVQIVIRQVIGKSLEEIDEASDLAQ
jgi:hypothetical protein